MIAFLFCVLVAIGFAIWGGLRQLFSMWALLFNAMIAIYTGIMLTPTLLEMLGSLESPGGKTMVLMLVTAIVIFVILQTITSSFLTGGFRASFTRFLDATGGALLGFVLGYLMAAYLVFSCYTLPHVSSHNPVSGDGKVGVILTGAALQGVCSFVNTVSLQQEDHTWETIDFLLTGQYDLLRPTLPSASE